MINEIKKRKTFAIISHPDAGKTTITEKILLFGGAIQLAGSIKARKSQKTTTSDWMEIEKNRGISITTSVMQFPFKEKIINLLDTPGHEDFSEDTYRTLSAVDSALMIIDAAKGVENRTIKLMKVCRMKNIPIITFINKFDKNSKNPIELLDEIEKFLNIQCFPVIWPIGMGREFKGIYHILKDKTILFKSGYKNYIYYFQSIYGINNTEFKKIFNFFDLLEEEIILIKKLYTFSKSKFLSGMITPIYFGSALCNFGIKELLEDFIKISPSPMYRNAYTRKVYPEEKNFSGFIFKIQANMNPKHHDRIAFLRICSGTYKKGMKIKHVRTGKYINISNALTFMAKKRINNEYSYAGDIIGIHNHGTIKIGDTFTEQEDLKFTGIPNFSPEIFRRIILKNPLKIKSLNKGLLQLSEEGAIQVFRPIINNHIIIGAIGTLQFDVVIQRLKDEYKIKCVYKNISITHARWIKCIDSKYLEYFKKKYLSYLSYDSGNYLTYLAPSFTNLKLIQERYPNILFSNVREN